MSHTQFGIDYKTKKELKEFFYTLCVYYTVQHKNGTQEMFLYKVNTSIHIIEHQKAYNSALTTMT